MKRLFTLLAALILAITASFAQHNFYFWEKNGGVSIEPMSEVDSLTFGVGNWLFQISKPVSLGATDCSFKGSAKVAINDKVKSIEVTSEVGICYSDENTNPTYNDLKKKLGSAIQDDYSFIIMDVTPGTTYYYRTYVKLLDEVYYSDINSITTVETQYMDINGHQFVDLGLPSGLLWARTNVGASSPSDDGDYFAWGETKSKSNYDFNSYKWADRYYDYYYYYSKYNSSDGKQTLDDLYDDAATLNWGYCSMPEPSDFEELYNKCDWMWLSSYKGTSGYLVTGPNGNAIFFPASGYRYKDYLVEHGSCGHYWSCSRPRLYESCAHCLDFNSGGVYPTACNPREYGFTVRPVWTNSPMHHSSGR